MSNILQLALFCVEHGLSVIPIRTDGTKAPASALLPLVDGEPSWKPFTSKIADEKQVRDWFERRNIGYAIIGGAVSGNLEILDFDEPGLFELFEDVCRDNGLEELLATLVVVETPKGGRHVYYRCEEPVETNHKLARRMVDGKRFTLIETRGEAGYVLGPKCPAACHPLGKSYRLVRGKLDAIPILTKASHDGLLKLARFFDDIPDEEHAAPAPKVHAPDGWTNPSGVSPGDDYNERGDFEQALFEAGWRRVANLGGKGLWRRPGKKSGISATSNYQGSRMFYAFSTNAAPFEAERKYAPFAVYAMLKHGGDFAAAARQLVHEGYGDKPARRDPPGEWPDFELASPDAPKPAPEKKSKSLEYMLAVEWTKTVKGQFLYCEGDQWFRYDHGRWRNTSAERVRSELQTYLAGKLKDGTLKTLTATIVRNTFFFAIGMLGPHELSEFNRHPNWIALRNGIYDVENDTLSEHSPDHMLTRQTDFDYDAEADCPLWRKCLNEWLIKTDGGTCDEWVSSIQEWFGYCLIADFRIQHAMFWVGEGANGKGTATRVLECLVGRDQCTAVPIEQLHDPYHRADLFGKLVGFVNEPDPRALVKNGSHFKAITGGDVISARRPTEKVFSFTSTVRIILSCNDLPSSRDASRGFFRRPIIIEWRSNFEKREKNLKLDEELATELSGIFNWAVEGLQRLRERGMKFVIPEASQELMKSYRADEDIIGRFIVDECEIDAFGKAQIGSAYQRYRNWCLREGQKPESHIAFGRRLGKLGFESKQMRDDVNRDRFIRCYLGFTLRSLGDDPDTAYSLPLVTDD